MDINFDRINNDLGGIIKEFEQLLNDGRYTVAKNAVEDLMYELGANTRIRLSWGGQTADHSFHEIYTEIVNKYIDKEASPAPRYGGTGIDYADLKTVLDVATTDVFQTAEVRQQLIQMDPDMQAYRDALQAGIAESTAHKEELQKSSAKYQAIERELFVDPATGTDRRTIIETERENTNQLQEVMDTIDVINSNIAAMAATTDPAVKASIQTQIDTQKNGLKNKLTQLQANGLDISSLGNLDMFLDDANLATSKTITEVLKDSRTAELIKQYDAIKQRIDDAKNGALTYTDSEGNVTNFQDEEVIRLAPDMATININTNAGRKQLETLIQDITAVSKRISNEMIVCDQEVEIYTDHVKVMDIEAELLSRDVNNRQAYIDAFDTDTTDKIEQEKTMRHEDAQAKFSGDRKKAKEYKEAWKRFKSHRKTQTATEIVDGVSYTYEYDYLEDYPEKEADLEFMQLESWEAKSKRTALIEKMLETTDEPEKQLELLASIYHDDSLEEINKIIAAQGGGAYGAYSGGTSAPVLDDALKAALEDARSRISMQYARERDYVEHYNSAHFDVKDTVALALTGGSAMRSRKNQSKKNLTFKDAVGAFFKWTPYDVKADGKRHVITTTLANIGGIASLPIRTLKLAIGAGIGGVTAAIGKITGTYDMPTPYNVGYFHRKEARQEYYREHGSSRLGAWAKSFFNMRVKDENGNKVKINDKIVQDRCKLIDESIEDKYIRGARAKLIEARATAKKNQRARAVAFKNRARSAELYEDIFENDPEYINASPEEKEKIAQRAMQRATLAMGGKSVGPITDQSKSYVTNGRKRDGRFVQENPEELFDDIDFDLSQDLDFSETMGDTIWTNAVSRENIQRGNTKGMDLALRISAAATLPFFKGLLSKWTIATKKKSPDQVIPGRHVDDKVEYVETTRTVYQHRPKYGDIQRTVEKDVPISYDNATFADLQRGDTAHWCAALGKYKGPHPAGKFSADATELQGFNLSFNDPLTGEHIEWSSSIPQIKQFINEHPGLHEATTTYQDLSGIQGMKISDLPELLPDNIKESYIRFLEASGDKGQAFNEATQFCWGLPNNGGPIMSQGWSESDVLFGALKRVTETETLRGIVGEELIPVEETALLAKLIEGYDIPDKVIEGAIKTIDIDKAITLGAMSDIADALSQCLAPRFRRGQKGTKNFHDVDVNGNALIDNDQGKTDMYDTPAVEDDNEGNPKKYSRYEHHHSINDRALTARNSKGKPTKDKRGKMWDDDDFTL